MVIFLLRTFNSQVSLMAVMSLSVPMVSYAGVWQETEFGNRWYKENGAYPTNAWRQIDGKYYFFDDSGYMLTDAITPDGYRVGADGVWIEGAVLEDCSQWLGKYEIDNSDNDRSTIEIYEANADKVWLKISTVELNEILYLGWKNAEKTKAWCYLYRDSWGILRSDISNNEGRTEEVIFTLTDRGIEITGGLHNQGNSSVLGIPLESYKRVSYGEKRQVSDGNNPKERFPDGSLTDIAKKYDLDGDGMFNTDEQASFIWDSATGNLKN